MNLELLAALRPDSITLERVNRLLGKVSGLAVASAATLRREDRLHFARMLEQRPDLCTTRDAKSVVSFVILQRS